MAIKIKAASKLEAEVWQWLRFSDQRLSWQREYRFHPRRKWRFDFALPSRMLAVEVEGLRYGGESRHTSYAGYTEDCRKYNAAAILGWKVIRGTQTMIRSGRLYQDIEAALDSAAAAVAIRR